LATLILYAFDQSHHADLFFVGPNVVYITLFAMVTTAYAVVMAVMLVWDIG
jgi:hypothetical protein